MTQRPVIFVLTGVGRMGAAAERRTGADLTETAECWEALQRRGIPVELVSVRGGAVPLTGRRGRPAEARLLADPRMRKQLPETAPVAGVDPEGYSALLLVGGHGAMWDFPDEPQLRRIVEGVDAAGRMVAAICHGSAGL